MGQADLQIGEAAIGEGAEMIGLVFDGGAEIGDGAVIQLEADVGQATPIQHLVIAQIEPQSGVVIADGALEKALARIGDAAVEIGAEIFRIEFDRYRSPAVFGRDERCSAGTAELIENDPVFWTAGENTGLYEFRREGGEVGFRKRLTRNLPYCAFISSQGIVLSIAHPKCLSSHPVFLF